MFRLITGLMVVFAAAFFAPDGWKIEAAIAAFFLIGICMMLERIEEEVTALRKATEKAAQNAEAK